MHTIICTWKRVLAIIIGQGLTNQLWQGVVLLWLLAKSSIGIELLLHGSMHRFASWTHCIAFLLTLVSFVHDVRRRKWLCGCRKLVPHLCANLAALASNNGIHCRLGYLEVALQRLVLFVTITHELQLLIAIEIIQWTLSKLLLFSSHLLQLADLINGTFVATFHIWADPANIATGWPDRLVLLKVSTIRHGNGLRWCDLLILHLNIIIDHWSLNLLAFKTIHKVLNWIISIRILMSKNLRCASVDVIMQLLFVNFQEILLVGIGIMISSNCLDLARSLLITCCNSLLFPYLPWFRQIWLILICVHICHIWGIDQLLIGCIRWLSRNLLRHGSRKSFLLLPQWLLAHFSLWFTTCLPVIFQARGSRGDIQVFLIHHCNLSYIRLFRSWSLVLLLYFDISSIIWSSLIWFWSILLFGSSALSRPGLFQWVNNLIANEAIFSIRAVPDSSLMSTISYPKRRPNSLKWWLILLSHSLSFQLYRTNKFLLHWVIPAALAAWGLHY